MFRSIFFVLISALVAVSTGCRGYDVGGGWLRDYEGEKWDERNRESSRADPTTASLTPRFATRTVAV